MEEEQQDTLVLPTNDTFTVKLRTLGLLKERKLVGVLRWRR